MLTQMFLYWLRASTLLTLIVPLFFTSSKLQANDHSDLLDNFLSKGKLEESSEHFAALKDDNQARVALGITQFLQGIERFGQDCYRYGLVNKYAFNLPLIRIPIPENPSPEPIEYELMRDILQRLQTQLRSAEESLAKVDTRDVQLTFYIGRARLDLDGDGGHSDSETLWRMFATINRGIDPQSIKASGEAFSVGVDGADVHWLRGYCHVLMGLMDMILAYEQRDLFERFGHLIFQKADSTFKMEDPEEDVNSWHYLSRKILDAIAVIHLIRFELQDADRMRSAHDHFLQMVQQSRLCWERALAETDNDREWLPNPDQVSVLQMRVDSQIITAWHSVLDELEAILNGEKLILDWRNTMGTFISSDKPPTPPKGRGINVKRMFTEPRDFDLVLTVQGSNLIPYMEEGTLSTPESWTAMTNLFQGQFFGFAVWFN